jgi:hypothetical protein
MFWLWLREWDFVAENGNWKVEIGEEEDVGSGLGEAAESRFIA